MSRSITRCDATDAVVRDELTNMADEWSVGIMTDYRAEGRHGVSLSRWPNKLRLEVDWPRHATGQAIAHELRKLADKLMEADDA